MKVRGHVVVRKNGQVVAEGKNLVVNTGFDLLAKLIGGTGTAPSHMASGNGGSATQATMTALQGTENERVALTSTTVSGNSVQYLASFGSGVSITVTIREFGIFNDPAAGEMLCRFICSGFDLSAGELVEVSWTITVTDLEG